MSFYIMKILSGELIAIFGDEQIAIILSPDAKRYWWIENEIVTSHSCIYKREIHGEKLKILITIYNSNCDCPVLPFIDENDTIFTSTSEITKSRWKLNNVKKLMNGSIIITSIDGLCSFEISGNNRMITITCPILLEKEKSNEKLRIEHVYCSSKMYFPSALLPERWLPLYHYALKSEKIDYLSEDKVLMDTKDLGEDKLLTILLPSKRDAHNSYQPYVKPPENLINECFRLKSEKSCPPSLLLNECTTFLYSNEATYYYTGKSEDEKNHFIEVLLHFDFSNILFDGSFFNHSLNNGDMRCYYIEACPQYLRTIQAEENDKDFDSGYYFLPITLTCSKLHAQIVNQSYKIISENDKKRTSKDVEEKKPKVLGNPIIEKSIVQDYGVFTAFYDGTVSAFFEDNTIVYLNFDHSVAKVILNSGIQIEVNCGHSLEVTSYVNITLEFAAFAFSTMEMRLENAKAKSIIENKINDTVLKTSIFLQCEVISSRISKNSKRMGAYLSEPKVEKETVQGEGNGLIYALSGMQGWRSEMEDSHIAESVAALPGSSFFGVFDGHGGSNLSAEAVHQTSGVLQEFLKSKNISADTRNAKLIGEEMRKAFISFDERLKPDCLALEERSGCTATTALITPTHIICANSGDSRTIYSKDGIAIPLSFDHKPSNEGEKARIEGAGGSVMMNRVNGDLAVSRALGDFTYKGNDSLPPEKQMVSPEPEITIVERNEKDEFVILACDGVWDVMKNQEAVDFVKNNLLNYPDLGLLCEAMLDECLKLNSRDNMTVCIVAFPNCPRVPDELKAGMYKKIIEEKEAKAAEEKARKEAEEAGNA